MNKSFYLFRSGCVVSNFGDQAVRLALIIYIINKTSSGTTLALILIPAICIKSIATPLMGPFGDIFRRKNLLLITTFTKWSIWLICTQINLSVANICIIYTSIALVAALEDSVLMAFVTELVPNTHLEKAYQMIAGTNSMAKIIGGVLGGGFVLYLGLRLTIFLNSSTFLLLFFIILFTKQINNNFSYCEEKIIPSNYYIKEVISIWKRKFLYGIKAVFFTPPILSLCIMLFLLQLIIAPLQIALPLIVKNIYSSAPVVLGIIESSIGIGCVVSSICFGYFVSIFSKYYNLLFGIILFSISMIFLGITNNIIGTVTLVFLCGFGITTANIIINSQLMKIIPQTFKARISSIVVSCETIASPLGLFLGGIIADDFGIMIMLFLSGILLFSFSFCTLFMNDFIIFVKANDYNELKDSIVLNKLLVIEKRKE